MDLPLKLPILLTSTKLWTRLGYHVHWITSYGHVSSGILNYWKLRIFFLSLSGDQEFFFFHLNEIKEIIIENKNFIAIKQTIFNDSDRMLNPFLHECCNLISLVDRITKTVNVSKYKVDIIQCVYLNIMKPVLKGANASDQHKCSHSSQSLMMLGQSLILIKHIMNGNLYAYKAGQCLSHSPFISPSSAY